MGWRLETEVWWRNKVMDRGEKLRQRRMQRTGTETWPLTQKWDLYSGCHFTKKSLTGIPAATAKPGALTMETESLSLSHQNVQKCLSPWQQDPGTAGGPRRQRCGCTDAGLTWTLMEEHQYFLTPWEPLQYSMRVSSFPSTFRPSALGELQPSPTHTHTYKEFTIKHTTAGPRSLSKGSKYSHIKENAYFNV